MQRVRRRRCELCILTGRRQSIGCERGAIVGMNQIMSRSWMIRVFVVQRFEDLCSFALLQMRRISCRRSGEQREGVEDSCLVICVLTTRQVGHRLFIRSNTIGMRAFVEV